jgi:hypothetical protein
MCMRTRLSISFVLVSALALSAIASSPVQAAKPKPWENRGYLNAMDMWQYKEFGVSKKTVAVKVAKKNKKISCFPKDSMYWSTWVPGVKIGTDKENNFVYWASYSDQANHYKEKANQTYGKQKRKNNKISEDFAKRAKSTSAESKACKSVSPKPKPWENRDFIRSSSLDEYKNSVSNKTVSVKVGKKNKRISCFPNQLNNGKRRWVPGVKLGTDTKAQTVYWASYSDQANHYKEKANQTKGKQNLKNKKISADYKKRAKSTSAESKACKSVAVLKLNSKNLAGLALVRGSTSNLRSANPEEFGMRNLFGSSTNLAGVNDNGVLVRALGSSSVNVRELVEAPDGSIYIIFDQRINLSDPDGYGWFDPNSSCAFARATSNSTNITCVDDSVEYVGSVQFDASGRVYYITNNSELRRANLSTSSITTMVRPTNGNIDNYRVTGDGYLIVRGNTGNNSWIRAYSPSRAAQEIGENSWGGLFDVFPDGNLYFSSNSEILKFDTRSLSVDPRSWIGHEGSETNPRWVSQNSWDIANASEFYRLPMGRSAVSDDRVYILYGSHNWDNGRSTYSQKAAQVYPTLIPDLQVGLTSTQIIEPAGSFLAVSGKNVVRNGAQTVTTYRTSILDGAKQTYRYATGLNGIEVFSMNYVKESNGLLINGEILATGVKVNGKYNLNTNTWTVTSRNTGRIEDLELFDN